MPIRLAVPVLRVADVARSIDWYRATLGFVGDPFPPSPPHEFAILRHGPTELTIELYHQDDKPLQPPTSGRDFANKMQGMSPDSKGSTQ